MEIAATLNCSGRGYSYHTRESGANSSSVASGAGHGSQGGSTSTGTQGGASHGSIYEPIALGARGGAVSPMMGTRGGGTMRLRVGHKFILDGLLIADGENVPSTSGKLLNCFLLYIRCVQH